LIGENQLTMRNIKERDFYQFAENLTTKWWFYAFLVLCVFIPPYTQNGFSSFAALVETVAYVADFLIENKLVLVPYMPIFHLCFLLLFGLLFIYGNRFGRTFSIVAGFHFVFITFLQGGAVTQKYGMVFYPNAFLEISLISFGWFWEAKIRKTDYSFKRKAPTYYWFAGIVMVFSFWNPDKLGTLSPLSLLTSTSPIAFCMITPIYLSLLSLLYPDINIPFFRTASFVAILVSLITIGMGFFMDNRSEGLYWSIIHSPMLITSVYCFLLGFQDSRSYSQQYSKLSSLSTSD
jgi:hypothetical protein